MASLISNGVYKIQNVKYPDSVVNLAGGRPYAAVTGWPKDSTSDNLRWHVTNLPNSKITLESAAAPGYYASTYNYSDFSPLFGAPNPTYWKVELLVGSPHTYYRIIAENNLALTLTEGGKEVSIYLRPIGEVPGEEQLWTLHKV